MKPSLFSITLFVISSIQLAFAQVSDTTFQKLIKSYPMKYENKSFSGPGWDVLQKEILKSQFVLIGEGHGHVEIPYLTKEVSKILKPEVFVGETDPYTIKEISRLLADKNPKSDYFQNNPWGLAFFSMEPEFELLKYLNDQKIKLWGLDQIHLFSSGRFFEMVAREAKKKENKLLALKKAKEFRNNDLPLFPEGKYDGLTVYKIKQNTVDSLIKAFEKESPYVKKMLEDFKITTDIYSNRDYQRRINLMKRDLLEYSLSYLSAGKPLPKMLFKMGAMHTFRNESFNIIFEVGNLAANFAEAQNNTSLHIFALGKAGTANKMSSSLEEKAIQPYLYTDDGLDFLAPFANLVTDDNPILFDLRPLRRKLDDGKIKIDNMDLKRTILGNEFLIIFGKVTGSGFKK